MCHPGGIDRAHDAFMDDIFLCPDCRHEHREPLDCSPGHRARCPDCATLAEMSAPAASIEALKLEIYIAA